MLKYVRANMGKTKSKLYPAMQLTHKHFRPEGAVPMVGLGWHMSNVGNDELIWHNGSTGEYTYAFRYQILSYRSDKERLH